MKKKKVKKKAIRGTMVGIRPRHIEAIKKMGKCGTEAESLESLNYSKSYAKNGMIKRTKSWKIISEEMLPNKLLAKVNLDLLRHKEWQARNAGLDKAYKAKKIYTNGTEIINNYGGKDKEALVDEVARRIAGLLGSR